MANKGILDIPDSADTDIKITYQYLIGSGDFIIDLDLEDYQKDASIGPSFKFFVDDVVGSLGNNRAHIQLYDNAGTWWINFYYKINGAATQNVGSETPSARPTKLRIVRSGNNIEGWYYDGGWDIIGSAVDFGIYASNIDLIKLSFIDTSNNRGGSVTFDNLRFRDGCPSGYPKAWTTTSTTTTMTTTTTTAPPP